MNYLYIYIYIYSYFDVNSFLIDVYFPTHTRATPYLVGMMVGFYVFKTHDKPLKLSKVWIINIIKININIIWFKKIYSLKITQITKN
jgi:peptidoglycan/LPS O-acetylase OafA/YrhL